jgi:putative redox protein
MATGSAHRNVIVKRVANGRFTVTNERGGEIAFGTGDGTDFTPTQIGADKVRDADGNRLTGIEVTFRLAFPATGQGDEARAILPDAVRKSHDRLCTVGRTVIVGTPVATRIER